MRTGPNRNHLGGHEGPAWLAADPKDRCEYDLEGNLLNRVKIREAYLIENYEIFGYSFPNTLYRKNKNSIFTKNETPDCTVEKLCRPHKSFGLTACLRDFYFELFDLEKNFGEKRFCPVGDFRFPGVKKKFKPYKDISDALGVESRTGLAQIKVLLVLQFLNK